MQKPKKELRVYYLKECHTPEQCQALLNPAWFSLMLVISGSLEFTLNAKDVKVSANHFLVIQSQATFRVISGPLVICLVSASRSFIVANNLARSGTRYLEFVLNQTPVPFTITQEDIEQVLPMIAILKNKVRGRSSNFFQDVLISLSFNLILYEFGYLSHRYLGNTTFRQDRKERLVLDFAGLVQLQCKMQHSVRFYADSLFVTTGYLSKIVKKLMGMPAKHFIEMSLISEAYILLANEKLSIEDISEELSFGDTSSFSVFFKRHTGLSPTKYRSGLRLDSGGRPRNK